MPVVFTFNKISEVRPEHRQDVVVIETDWRENLGSVSLREVFAESIWIEYDENGRSTGNVLDFTPGETPPANCKLETIFGSRLAQDEDLWMYLKDFQKTFAEAK